MIGIQVLVEELARRHFRPSRDKQGDTTMKAYGEMLQWGGYGVLCVVCVVIQAMSLHHAGMLDWLPGVGWTYGTDIGNSRFPF